MHKIHALKEVNDVKEKLEIEWDFWLKTKRTEQTVKFQKGMKNIEDVFIRDLKKAIDSGKPPSMFNINSLVNKTIKSVNKRISSEDPTSKASVLKASKERQAARNKVDDDREALEKNARIGKETAIRVRDDSIAELKRNNRETMISLENNKNSALEKRLETQEEALEKRNLEIQEEFKRNVELLE